MLRDLSYKDAFVKPLQATQISVKQEVLLTKIFFEIYVCAISINK